MIKHSVPVPSEWLESLNNEGFECFSYIPHGAFHCLITSTPVQDLIDLDVQGIMMLDPTDKVHPMIDELLEGEFEHGYTIFGKGIVTKFFLEILYLNYNLMSLLDYSHIVIDGRHY